VVGVMRASLVARIVCTKEATTHYEALASIIQTVLRSLGVVRGGGSEGQEGGESETGAVIYTQTA